MSQTDELMHTISEFRATRRGILRSATAGAFAMAAGAILPGCGGSGSAGGGTAATAALRGFSQTDILNFALNFEYLGATYYSLATTGQPIGAADSGHSTATIPGDVFPTSGPVSFSNYGQLANEFAADELAHVRLLRSVLGSNAVARPPLDLVNSFNTAAAAAGIPGGTFNPFDNEIDFLVGAFVFEDVDVTAYEGGAASLASNSSYLSTAAGIMGVEAYHAGAIRSIIIQLALNGNTTALSNANLISQLRAKADGSSPYGNETSPGTPSAAFVVDANPITAGAYARTPQQVLNIAYLDATGVAVHSGGFFPNGLQGNIT